MVIKDTLKKVRYRTKLSKKTKRLKTPKTTTLKVIREKKTRDPYLPPRAKQKITFFPGKFTYSKNSHTFLFD